MDTHQLDEMVEEVKRLKHDAARLPEDNPSALQEKTDLLIQAHVLLGEIAGEYNRVSRILHVQRKQEYWNAYEGAIGNKRMAAERAVYETEMMEAQAAGNYRLYQNEFTAMEEVIHGLKQKMRVAIADGSIGGRYRP